jgi:hypothetical protein
MEKKRYRPRGVQVIQACDWCGGAFAKPIRDGMFCTVACAIEKADHDKQVRRKMGAPMTVSELIDFADGLPRD